MKSLSRSSKSFGKSLEKKLSVAFSSKRFQSDWLFAKMTKEQEEKVNKLLEGYNHKVDV